MTKNSKTSKTTTQPSATARSSKKTTRYVSFNIEETERLRSVGFSAHRLYFELKWLASFKTGKVQKSPFVPDLSYAELARRISQPSKQGRAATHFDGTQAKRLLDELEAIGLAKDIQRDAAGQLCMTLPWSPLRAAPTDTEPHADLAVTDQSASNAATQPPAAPTREPEVDDDDVGASPENTDSLGGKLSDHDTAKNMGFERETEPQNHRSSVLTNTKSQYHFSVRDSVLCDDPSSHSRCANGAAGLVDKFLPYLNARQIQNRLKEMYPDFRYLDNPVSLKLFARIEGLKVEPMEFDAVAMSMINMPTCDPTPKALFDELVERRKPKPWRLGARVAL